MATAPTKTAMPLWLRLKLQQARAEELLRRFKIATPAIDPFLIAREMGITVEMQRGVPFSGMVSSDSEGAHIIVNAAEVPWRQRFTVAHEIGHILLHPLGEAFRDRTFAGNEQERQANAFAADLLMPLWMVEPYAMKHGADSQRIAAIFEVSEQAMNIRLGNLVGRL
jgi:Zn-dependent peptidase ImmA (M78 family)